MAGYLRCTEVRFANFLSGGFTTMAVINPPEKRLAKRISVQCVFSKYFFSSGGEMVLICQKNRFQSYIENT